MTGKFGLLTLGALLALAPAAAQAQAVHAAKPIPAPTAKARQAAMDGFTARMSRLDALMGARPATRTRSASASDER
jgi:hypothetical protein